MDYTLRGLYRKLIKYIPTSAHKRSLALCKIYIPSTVSLCIPRVFDIARARLVTSISRPGDTKRVLISNPEIGKRRKSTPRAIPRMVQGTSAFFDRAIRKTASVPLLLLFRHPPLLRAFARGLHGFAIIGCLRGRRRGV